MLARIASQQQAQLSWFPEDITVHKLGPYERLGHDHMLDELERIELIVWYCHETMDLLQIGTMLLLLCQTFRFSSIGSCSVRVCACASVNYKYAYSS